MITLKKQIINKLGLHARASAKFVATAARFQSQLEVSKDGQLVNGKSIMGVMMLGASKGVELTLSIDGPDEQEMAQSMSLPIDDKFGESE